MCQCICGVRHLWQKLWLKTTDRSHRETGATDGLVSERKDSANASSDGLMSGSPSQQEVYRTASGRSEALSERPRYELPTVRQVMVAAAVCNVRAWELASWELRNNRDLILDAVSRNARVLKYASEALRSDPVVVLAAMHNNTKAAMKYATFDMRKNRQLVMAAVRRYWWVLGWALPCLRGDEEVVMKAVKTDGFALGFAVSPSRDDEDIVLAAVKNRGRALQFASPALRGNRDIVLAAVRQDGDAIYYASPEMQVDNEVWLAAQRQILKAPWVRAPLFDPSDKRCPVKEPTLPLNASPRWRQKVDIFTSWECGIICSGLAQQGEEGAPVVNIELQREERRIGCTATFASGRSFQLSLNRMATMGDLAARLVYEKPRDMQAFDRVFLVIQTDSRTHIVTPWERSRPIKGFLPEVNQ